MTKAKNAVYSVHFRRRRNGRTDYSRRLALLKSGKPRMVVRKTNRYVIVQFFEQGEKGDKALASVSSKSLSKFGFAGKCNTPSAYLTGFLCGKKAAAAGVKDFVLDLGLHAATKGSLLFAALKGAIDAGLQTNYGEEKLPDEDRMSGKVLKVDSQFAEAKAKISAEKF